ncbi:hypothetical protein HZ993_16720 [Rhodoferax sp. AJA081-3]|uniref:hypothetical protein n=1 Tax=Rhodoferax sp. AJA081-3 TaxID=2752316 RepID=UPI001ADF6C77|nr:hypothetical protein [Rhodoferax sp. AJA081-3]QTN26941.1 hypothetical protein HZ993_16720 [Rhodoferax sp. AJA081-3]
MDQEPQPLKPLPPDLACLVQRLVDLRNALEETVLALSDYQCTLDSEDTRAAGLQVVQAIERAKARDYSAGAGPHQT